MLINNWSLRALAGPEKQTGFGWIQAKPACSMAPFAVTPDGLGAGWEDGRVQLKLRVERDGAWFGEPHGGAMGWSFPELIAHAAGTRSLCAGTIVGSGTVSNDDYAGSCCIAERRAIETLEGGAPSTGGRRRRTVAVRRHRPAGDPLCRMKLRGSGPTPPTPRLQRRRRRALRS